MFDNLNDAVKALNLEAVLSLVSRATLETDEIEDLVQAYIAAARQNPAQTSAYTSFLRDLEASGRLPEITLPSREHPIKEEFSFLMKRELFETIRDLLDTDQDLDIHPQNSYLFAAVVSGACMGTEPELCTCSDQIASIDIGLQLEPGYGELEKKQNDRDEIRAVHACLQVLIAGREYPRHDRVAAAVKHLINKGVVKNDNGKALLEVSSM